MSFARGKALWRAAQILLASCVLLLLLVGLVCLVLGYIGFSENNSSLVLRSLVAACVAFGGAWLLGRGVRVARYRATDHAIAEHAALIRDDPANADAHFARATMCAAKRDFARAIAHCDAALRSDPARPYVHVARVNAYGGLNQWDRVIAEYSEAIERDPNDALAYCARATAHNGVARFDRSIPDATEAIRLAPTLFLGYDARGYGLLQQGKCTWAVKVVALAWMLVSLGFLRRDNPAWTVRLGSKADFHQAVADFTEAIRLHELAVDCYQGRALAYRALGDTVRAAADEAVVRNAWIP